MSPEMKSALLLLVLLQGADTESVLDKLERTARSAKTVQADYVVTGVPGCTNMYIQCDLARRQAYVRLGRSGDGSSDLNMIMEGGKGRQWSKGEEGTLTNFQPYYDRMEQGLGSILSRWDGTLGKDSAGLTNQAWWTYSIDLDLERKPSKDERGAFRYWVFLGRMPFNWLRLLRAEKEASVREDGPLYVFRIPSRRKTVVIDRDTALVKSIETVDYDGKVGSVVCRSSTLNGVLPEPPAPPKCAEKPVSRDELKGILFGRTSAFRDALRSVIPKWEAMKNAGLGRAVGEACGRELTDFLSLRYEVSLHEGAAKWIRERMNTGISWRDLKQDADTDAGVFASMIHDQSEEWRHALADLHRQFLDAFDEDCKTYRGKGAEPAGLRATMEGAFDFEAAWAQQVKTAEKRARQAYAEELEKAGAL
jgi:hypothetical protein